MSDNNKNNSSGTLIFIIGFFLIISFLINNLFIQSSYQVNEPINYLDVGLGNVSGYDSIYKFGYNSDVGTSEEVIWDGGGEYIFLNSAEKMSVVSSSNLDSNGGDGAWNLTIVGLDSNYNQITENIILNGNNPVITDNEFLRVFRAYVGGVGISSSVQDSNIGDITITSVNTLILQASILEHQGQTQMVVYTVPSNFYGCFLNADANVGKGKDAVVRLKVRQCEGSKCPFNTKAIRQLYENNFNRDYSVPRCIGEKLDVVMTAESSAAGTTVSASFEMLLISKEAIIKNG